MHFNITCEFLGFFCVCVWGGGGGRVCVEGCGGVGGMHCLLTNYFLFIQNDKG